MCSSRCSCCARRPWMTRVLTPSSSVLNAGRAKKSTLHPRASCRSFWLKPCVHGVFPVHELFWCCRVQVSTTQFCSFSSFLVARVSDGTDVPASPVPASSSNMGSPNGSFPGFERTGYHPSTMEEKINEMFIQVAKLPLLMQSISRFESCVQTLSQTVASYDAKITNIEQIVGSLAAQVTTLETVSSGHSAPQPLSPSGPMARGLRMTTGTQNVDLILFPAQRMNMHEVPFCFDFHVNNITREYLPGSTASLANLPEYTAKHAPCLLDSYSKQKPNARTVWPDIKGMVSPLHRQNKHRGPSI